MPGAMPNEMSREAAAPSSAAPPSRSFLRSMFARCVGEEQEQQAGGGGDQDLPIGPQSSAGDSQEVLQLRMQVAQMQAQMATLRTASEVAPPPPPHNVSAAAMTENPFGFPKAELLTLAMTCEPAALKAEMALVLARLRPRSQAACQLLNFSSSEFEVAVASSAEWREIDSNLATLFVSLIDKEQPHGKNFYTKAAKRPDLLTSGYMISSYLISSTNPQTGKELEERVMRVQDNQYFD